MILESRAPECSGAKRINNSAADEAKTKLSGVGPRRPIVVTNSVSCIVLSAALGGSPPNGCRASPPRCQPPADPSDACTVSRARTAAYEPDRESGRSSASPPQTARKLGA
ncbi:hypothetical protein AAFF_G00095660 [Aldrovandia affinis]|uniref:Uncharacterized protein n=1 Tax=Aldrovandia affinis TaxID=143900 RepID=A0AAD7WBM1_9TELE|nr:hypothetical protein AAFF_G00095660 [Aldrovandia affinis]